jgi:hypothetical protein
LPLQTQSTASPPVLSGPKVVSDRIGHANVGFFLQTHAHVLKNDDVTRPHRRRRSSWVPAGRGSHDS